MIESFHCRLASHRLHTSWHLLMWYQEPAIPGCITVSREPPRSTSMNPSGIGYPGCPYTPVVVVSMKTELSRLCSLRPHSRCRVDRVLLSCVKSARSPLISA